MAKEYIYSRNFSDQVQTVTTLEQNDLLLLSIKTIVNGETVWQTKTATALDLAKVTELYFIDNNTISKLHYGIGLTGNGTEENPLTLSRDWFDNNYISAESWPFTQVGEMSEETLPISGTYLSVAFPYNTAVPNRPVVCYLEGNGDLRILRAVTNGEETTYVYSLWRNYRNTERSTVVNTDNEYKPTGLLSDEYIGHCFTASDTAMVVEINTKHADGSSSFKEHAIVLLNGTLIGRHHTLRRLGATALSDTLIGSSQTAANARTIFRRGNVTATMMYNKLYVGFMPATNLTNFIGTTAYKSAVKFAVAEVDYENKLNLIYNWSITNEFGGSTTNSDGVGVYLSKGFYENNVNGVDSYFVPLEGVDGSDCHVQGLNTAAHADCRWSWSCTLDQEIVVVLSHTIDGYSYDTYRARTSKATMFLLNPVTGKGRAFPRRTGKPHRIKPMETAGMMNDYAQYYQQFNSTSQSNLLMMMPDGMRIAYRSSSESTFENNIFVSTPNGQTVINDPWIGADDSLWSKIKEQEVVLTVTPPTPLTPSKLATVMHDRLIAFDSGYRGTLPLTAAAKTKNVYADLKGDVDSTYNLVSSANQYDAETVKGYELNSSRGYLPNTQVDPTIVSYTDGNSIYYHNAIWSSVNTSPRTCYYAVDRNLESSNKYLLSQAVYDKLKAFLPTLPLTSGFDTTSGDTVWYLTPFYPGIGKDKALLEYHRVEFKNSTADGSGSYVSHNAVCNITQSRASDGTYTVTDIELVTENFISTAMVGVMRYIDPTGYNYLASASVAIKDSGDRVDVLSRNGSRYIQVTDIWYARDPSHIVFDVNGKGIKYRHKLMEYVYPCIDPKTKALGVVALAGAGAMYGFKELNAETSTLATTFHTVYSSPRPPAGFNVNISSPIELYICGNKYVIEPFSKDLTSIVADPANMQFYIYAEVINDQARLWMLPDKLPEHQQLVHIGVITTTATDIAKIETAPVTRWEMARPSTTPIGNAFSVSVGHPSVKTGETWLSAEISDGVTNQYLWENKDIVDVDDYQIRKIYFAHDADGVYEATNLNYNVPFYVIVEADGNPGYFSGSLDVLWVDREDVVVGLQHGPNFMFETPFQYIEYANISIASHKFIIQEPKLPGFEVMRWMDMTQYRAIDTTYVNTEPYTLLATVTCSVSETTSGNVTGYVNGVPVGLISSYKARGGVYATTDTMTFVIPAGASYNVASTPGFTDIYWAELRKIVIGG